MQGIPQRLQKLFPFNKKHAEKATCYLVYTLIALTIAAPGAAIVATNVNADMVGPTATVVRSSGYLPLEPLLELTLTETVELDYRPDNYVTSMVVGILLVAGTMAWGMYSAIRLQLHNLRDQAVVSSLCSSNAI